MTKRKNPFTIKHKEALAAEKASKLEIESRINTIALQLEAVGLTTKDALDRATGIVNSTLKYVADAKRPLSADEQAYAEYREACDSARTVRTCLITILNYTKYALDKVKPFALIDFSLIKHNGKSLSVKQYRDTEECLYAFQYAMLWLADCSVKNHVNTCLLDSLQAIPFHGDWKFSGSFPEPLIADIFESINDKLGDFVLATLRKYAITAEVLNKDGVALLNKIMV